VKILTVEDDALSRELLKATLEKAGHDVISCVDGESAFETYKRTPDIEMAVRVWVMSGMDGLEVCKEIKAVAGQSLIYVIMLTAQDKAEDLALALDSGADDYVSKPFNQLELNARINAGIRTVRLQKAMMSNITELQKALAHVDQLQGILPICAWCKKIRDDSQFWCSVEDYLSQYSKVQLSHGICPECQQREFPRQDCDENVSAPSEHPVTLNPTE